MKRVGFLIVLVTSLFLVRAAPAQGTLYLASLGGGATGTRPIGSDSWWAQGFFTGTNSAGYTLNSMELLMAAATGSPSDLTVSLYSLNFNTGPGESLADLNGLFNPTTAGTYSYAGSGVILLPNTGLASIWWTGAV